MKMKKTLLSMFLAAGLGLSTGYAGAATPDYQDWWWNPAQSGMGVNVGQRADTLVVAWYLFDSDGQGMYLMLSGALEGGNRLSGTLHRTTGPAPGPGYSPSLVNSFPVGTATLEFSSVREGVLTYNYEGISGSLTLQRYVFEGPPDVSAGAMLGHIEETGCNSDAAADLYPTARDNVPIQVKTTEVGNGIYNLKFGFAGLPEDYWSCEANNIALTLDKGVWRGAGSVSCVGRNEDIIILLPPVLPHTGALSINALRMNGNNSFFDWSVDFSAAVQTSCTVGGVFRGFAVELDD